MAAVSARTGPSMTAREWRMTWIGWGVAAVGSVVFTIVFASLESTVNTPGTRNVAPPVLWAVGGGIGLAAGACIASAGAHRFWTGALAVLIGAVPMLVVVVIGYNSGDLKMHDQLFGSLLVVVAPAMLAGFAAAGIAVLVSRFVPVRSRRRST